MDWEICNNHVPWIATAICCFRLIICQEGGHFKTLVSLNSLTPLLCSNLNSLLFHFLFFLLGKSQECIWCVIWNIDPITIVTNKQEPFNYHHWLSSILCSTVSGETKLFSCWSLNFQQSIKHRASLTHKSASALTPAGVFSRTRWRPQSRARCSK